MTVSIVRRRIAPDVGETPCLPGPAHPLLDRIYKARGVTQPEQLVRTLDSLIPGSLMKGMDEATRLLAEAVSQQQSIVIVGDFDTDGATSVALAVLALKAMGATRLDFLVPDRFRYGYGLSAEIVETLCARAVPDLLITVDNGISSIEGVAAARAANIKVLVTDHHLAGDELPQADAIVNPNQPGCPFPAKNTAGVGVIFYVLCALRTRLDSLGWFSDKPKPNMAQFLDLVALGTVADLVGLDTNNRILVHQGMSRIRALQTRPGILALADVARRDPARLETADLGFALAPRLNAAGRLESMSVGIELLITDAPLHAYQLACQLDQINRERRTIETRMKEEALSEIEQIHTDDTATLPWGLCLFRDHWHQGVLGILASRLKEKLHRPVITFACGREGEIKGSARSIPGFHMRDALARIEGLSPGLLLKFGGHAMAAGLSLRQHDFPRFASAFDQIVRQQLTEDQLQARLFTDGSLSDSELNLATAELLRTAGPWGQQFPEPVFDGLFTVKEQRIVGNNHLKMQLMPMNSRLCLDAIWFNVDTCLWPDDTIGQVRLVYRLNTNVFRGSYSLQLMVEHLEVT
ncbi:MAG: single-stranded-DNA-specific exonuclease RecJ [Kistimonas sp.]|nr:single-stranded-DNA-specific exonuclease RecJ [Kistimonas sp.]